MAGLAHGRASRSVPRCYSYTKIGEKRPRCRDISLKS